MKMKKYLLIALIGGCMFQSCETQEQKREDQELLALDQFEHDTELPPLNFDLGYVYSHSMQKDSLSEAIGTNSITAEIPADTISIRGIKYKKLPE
jgi:hypothetical protein